MDLARDARALQRSQNATAASMAGQYVEAISMASQDTLVASMACRLGYVLPLFL